MEKPGDDYKETHNLVFKNKDTTFGGQVSRLQIAEVCTAALIVEDGLADNKVRPKFHGEKGARVVLPATRFVLVRAGVVLSGV